jgi:hypothetical protein
MMREHIAIARVYKANTSFDQIDINSKARAPSRDSRNCLWMVVEPPRSL